eukprot:2552525-Amphidinium_carterae.1
MEPRGHHRIVVHANSSLLAENPHPHLGPPHKNGSNRQHTPLEKSCAHQFHITTLAANAKKTGLGVGPSKR